MEPSMEWRSMDETFSGNGDGGFVEAAGAWELGQPIGVSRAAHLVGQRPAHAVGSGYQLVPVWNSLVHYLSRAAQVFHVPKRRRNGTIDARSLAQCRSSTARCT